MKKLWKSSNLGGKIFYAVVIALCIFVLGSFGKYITQGIKNDINKEDNERMDKYEQFIENSNSKINSVYNKLEDIEEDVSEINKRSKNNKSELDKFKTGLYREWFTDWKKWKKLYEDSN